MIKVEFKRWFLDVLHRQTWFGYTYFTITSTDPDDVPNGCWFRNNSKFVKEFNELSVTDTFDAESVGIIKSIAVKKK